MNVLDSIIDKAKDVAGAAGKKTGELVEISKYKLQAAQIHGDIRSGYEKLGSAVYSMVKAEYDNPELINSVVEDIDELLSKLEEVEEKIAQLRRVVKCPCCKASNPAESRYCSRCGCKLEQPSKSNQEIQLEAPEQEEDLDSVQVDQVVEGPEADCQ